MADFKRGGGFGGGDRGDSRGGGDFKRGGFGKPRFGSGGGKPSFRPSFNRNEGGRGDGEQKEMFDAICSTCGRTCQVPFRPSGDRPIFCKDCFSKENDRRGEGPNDSRGRSDFTPPRTSVIRRDDSFSQRPAPASHDPRIDDLKRDLAYAHTKLDKLVELIGAMALTSAVKKAATPVATEEVKAAKVEKPAKPTQKKKKAK